MMTLARKLVTISTVLLVAAVTGGAASGPSAWMDPHSGIAIGGYDPLAYQTHGKAVVGVPELEYFWDGVTWRFANEGNRAEFAAHPDVYVPKFAGYDCVALANGRLIHGAPEIWELMDGKLFLFGSEKNRSKWRKDKKTITSKVEKLWPRLSKERQDFRANAPLPDLYRQLTR